MCVREPRMNPALFDVAENGSGFRVDPNFTPCVSVHDIERIAQSAAAFAALVRNDIARWAKVIKATHIKAD